MPSSAQSTGILCAGIPRADWCVGRAGSERREERMITRLIKAALLAAVLAAIVASVPDVKRYLELRDM
jgi:hypothetical protein